MSERVSVVVPSRGPASRLRRLLDSLAAQTIPVEAIVVDNASPQGEVAALCDSYGFASAIPLGGNRGFSAPVNLGVACASAPVAVLLNDDCVVEPGFAERIAAPIDPDAGIVMVASVMRDAIDPGLIDSAGMELDGTLLVYDYLNGEPLSAAEHAADPIGPSAAAAAFDREAFLAVGGFDEHLFAYWEDVDLVLRLRAAGGRCVLARDAIGTHEHSSTLGSGSVAKNYLMGYGRGYTLRKWSVLASPRRLFATLTRELVLIAGQVAIDRNAAGLRGRVRGWRDAIPYAPFPAEIAARGGGASLGRNLARRLARRRRLRRRLSA
jgi:GT2 family glycosyltransferase